MAVGSNPVSFEDYERWKRHPGTDEATAAHMAVSHAITRYGENPTTGTRADLLRAIHLYADECIRSGLRTSGTGKEE